MPWRFPRHLLPSPKEKPIKRFVDILISILVLLLMSPILLAAALAIWLESGKPVLFRQVRVGRGFERFQILKFRTMLARSAGPLITVHGDSRITRIGGFLRITKLDEI